MTGTVQTLSDISTAIATRATSVESAARSALFRAHALNPTLNCLVDIFDDHALAQAKAIDARLASGENAASIGPLCGVPVVLKDNICLSHGRTTCGSRYLENFRSPYTATAAQRLIDAGAIIIAKGNLDEFAMGSSGEHSCFGPTKNPWDTSRVPGGSSSGSAVSVAAGIVPVALGSDTGGSIRMPAGLCNVVGFKPTYGRVSRHGLVAYASSLDQIGPFAHTVADAALVASVLSGVDANDSTSADAPVDDWLTDLHTPVNRLVIGVPSFARSSANHESVALALDHAIKSFQDMGAEVFDIELPHAPHGIAAYYLIATAEASSNLARFDGIRYGRRAALQPQESLADLYARSRSEGFGHEVQRRIMLGTHVLSSGYYDAYYTTALKVRRRIKQDFDAAFQGVPGRPACHAILSPVSPSPAFKIGEKTADPLAMYLEDAYTVGVNLAGLPAITIPAAFAAIEGRDLPIGVQLIGPAMQEASLLRIARMLEQGLALPNRTPSLVR